MGEGRLGPRRPKGEEPACQLAPPQEFKEVEVGGGRACRKRRHILPGPPPLPTQRLAGLSLSLRVAPPPLRRAGLCPSPSRWRVLSEPTPHTPYRAPRWQPASPGARPRPTCAPSSSSVCPSSSSSLAAAAPRGTSGRGGRQRRGAGVAAAAGGAWRRRARTGAAGERGRVRGDRLARGRRGGRGGGGSTRPRCVSRPRWRQRRQPRDR